MRTIEHNNFIPVQGTYFIHAEMAINTDASKTEAATVASGYATGGILHKNLFGEDKFIAPWQEKPKTGGIVYSTKLPGGYRINVSDPSGQYSDHAVMFTVGNPDHLLANADQEIPTHTLYDLPEEVQYHMWEQTLTVVRAYLEYFKRVYPGEEVLVFLGENCICIRTCERARTSRTIVLPHHHVVPIRLRDIDQTTPVAFDHLTREQEAFRSKTFRPFVDFVHKQLPTDVQKYIGPFTLHYGTPVGYTFTIPGNISNELFTRCMNEHHKAFSTIAASLTKFVPHTLREHLSIPMPSYRLYVSYTKDGDIQCNISIEALSACGVMESMGVALKRSPDVPKRVTPQERTAYLSHVTGALDRKLRD